MIALLLLALAAQEPPVEEAEALPAFDLAPASAVEWRASIVRAAAVGLRAVRETFEAAAAAPPEIAAALDADRAWLDAAAALPPRLRRAIEIGKSAPRSLEARGDVEAVDESGLSVRPRRGEPIRLDWEEIPLGRAAAALHRDLRARDPADLGAAAAASLLAGEIEEARKLSDLARRGAGAGSTLPDAGPLLAAYADAAREAAAIERLEAWASAEALDPEAVRKAVAGLGASSVLARNRPALRARVRAALAAALAGRDRLASLFAGEAKVLGDGLVEVRYDFADAAQLRDFSFYPYAYLADLWLGTLKQGIDQKGFEIEGGSLVGIYRASFFHRAVFEPDCSVEADIRLDPVPGFAPNDSPVAVGVGFTYDQGRNFVASMSLKGIWQLTNDVDDHASLEGVVLPRPGERARVRFERISGRVRALRDGKLEREADDRGPPRGQPFVWLQGAARLVVDDVVVRGRLAGGWLRQEASARAAAEAASVVP